MNKKLSHEPHTWTDFYLGQEKIDFVKYDLKYGTVRVSYENMFLTSVARFHADASGWKKKINQILYTYT